MIQEGNPPPAPRTTPPRPTRPPSPPHPRPSTPPSPSIRFRPRQPELLEERQSNPLTVRQIKRRRNKINKLNKQVKSSERELEDLMSERDSIMEKVEGARRFGAQRRKRIRYMNRELNKINEKIKESEKVLENSATKLNIMEPAPLRRSKRIEKKIAEIIRKIRRAKKKNRESLIAKREALKIELKEENWNPEVKVLDGAFGRAYRRYRIDGRPQMDPDTYFNRIRSQLIVTLKKESSGRSVKVQMTTWIRFKQDEELAELAFNSRMMNVHNLSEIEEIVDKMIAHMREQIENLALANSRFVFDSIGFYTQT